MCWRTDEKREEAEEEKRRILPRSEGKKKGGKKTAKSLITFSISGWLEAGEHSGPLPSLPPRPRFIIARLLLFVAGDPADVSDKVGSSQWLGRYFTDNYLMTTK